MFTYHYLTMLDRQHGCDMGAAYLELSMQLSVAVVKSVTEPGAVSGVERSLSCLVSSSHVCYACCCCCCCCCCYEEEEEEEEERRRNCVL
jgi:hypothetical protein